MLWPMPGSYGQLQQAARMARATVAAGLAALERLGLLQRTKHRVLAVSPAGGRVWRQLTSSYRLLPVDHREFTARTDSEPKCRSKIILSRWNQL